MPKAPKARTGGYQCRDVVGKVGVHRQNTAIVSIANELIRDGLAYLDHFQDFGTEECPWTFRSIYHGHLAGQSS